MLLWLAPLFIYQTVKERQAAVDLFQSPKLMFLVVLSSFSVAIWTGNPVFMKIVLKTDLRNICFFSSIHLINSSVSPKQCSTTTASVFRQGMINELNTSKILIK
jgi:hypothetical protein